MQRIKDAIVGNSSEEVNAIILLPWIKACWEVLCHGSLANELSIQVSWLAVLCTQAADARHAHAHRLTAGIY
jgi:hypothetical protein